MDTVGFRLLLIKTPDDMSVPAIEAAPVAAMFGAASQEGAMDCDTNFPTPRDLMRPPLVPRPPQPITTEVQQLTEATRQDTLDNQTFIDNTMMMPPLEGLGVLDEDDPRNPMNQMD
jgi:hypothetical protein